MNQEQRWDKLLRVRTTGRKDAGADEYRYPYEPTPYCVLERLADSGLVGENDVVLDYGCGKGRVGFFLAHRTGAKTIGIEYDGEIFDYARENQKTALSGGLTDFVLTRAEEYRVPESVTRCYFFNPFSVEILHKVLARLLMSWYLHPREILLFFYYPSMEYISHLMTVEELEFEDELECDDLFAGGDLRERILMFRLPGETMEPESD